MTASQSSSVMLNNMRSRVIPALLTTMLRPAEAVGRFHQFVGGGPLADVACDGDGLGPGGGDLVDDIGFVQRAGDVVDHDGGARAGKADGLGAAQARGRAGHHRDQSGQISRVRVFGVNL